MKKGQQVTGVWQKWRFSTPQTHLWLIKHWFSASKFVVKIATFAKRQTVMGNAMKTTLNILTGLFLLLTSCNNSTTDDRKNYVESEPTFFELRNGDWLTNKWIRKPESLLKIHETFKKVGYMNLITDNLLFETYKYQDLKWNKDSLATSLKQSDKFIYPWFQDNTK